MSNLGRNLKEKMVLDLTWCAILPRIASHYAKAHSVIWIPSQETTGLFGVLRGVLAMRQTLNSTTRASFNARGGEAVRKTDQSSQESCPG